MRDWGAQIEASAALSLSLSLSRSLSLSLSRSRALPLSLSSSLSSPHLMAGVGAVVATDPYQALEATSDGWWVWMQSSSSLLLSSLELSDTKVYEP